MERNIQVDETRLPETQTLAQSSIDRRQRPTIDGEGADRLWLVDRCVPTEYGGGHWPGLWRRSGGRLKHSDLYELVVGARQEPGHLGPRDLIGIGDRIDDRPNRGRPINSRQHHAGRGVHL